MKVYIVVNGFPEEGWGIYGVYSNPEAANAHAKVMADRELERRNRERDHWSDLDNLELRKEDKGWSLNNVDYFLVFELALQDDYAPQEDAP